MFGRNFIFKSCDYAIAEENYIVMKEKEMSQ